jgi:hypothetical protein
VWKSVANDKSHACADGVPHREPYSFAHAYTDGVSHRDPDRQPHGGTFDSVDSRSDRVAQCSADRHSDCCTIGLAHGSTFCPPHSGALQHPICCAHGAPNSRPQRFPLAGTLSHAERNAHPNTNNPPY